MIHDVLLSCLDLHSTRLPLQEFLVSDAVSTFLHAGEKKMLQDIIDIINLMREIAKFIKLHGCIHVPAPATATKDADGSDTLQNGLYLNAFAKGIETVLNAYLADIVELERSYLQNPQQSLLFIYKQLQIYQPLAVHLHKLIRNLRLQKQHGCGIVQFLFLNMQNGDVRIFNAMKTILRSVTLVFLKQLANWLLYAKASDTYCEFFIQFTEQNTLDSERATSIGSGREAANTISDAASIFADIWRYEISYELLPRCLSDNWAEKVLFIGQTVLMFKLDENKLNKNAMDWNLQENLFKKGENFLWNGKEHEFFDQIQSLQSEEMNVNTYERVVDDIKNYVTTRLSEIAVNQADLVQQLKLIKDYYLLGRGELFLEFIRQTYLINRSEQNENKMRDFVRAFEFAASSIGVSEDLQQFSLVMTRPTNSDSDANDGFEFAHLQCMQLKYKINWPLHLLFSPKVIERYNALFRFLLLIKEMEYKLGLIWSTHIRSTKQYGLHNRNFLKVSNLRSQLTFFFNNLQYYLQVDVLESQYSILINTILGKADFEQIQRAHSIFQANVLSLCFLLNDKSNLQQSMLAHSSNPVYAILNDIFHLCEQFCNVLKLQSFAENPNVSIVDFVLSDEVYEQVKQLDVRFAKLMEQLMNMLVSFKTSQSTTPLSQLLLRLDFNRWFSMKRKS